MRVAITIIADFVSTGRSEDVTTADEVAEYVMGAGDCLISGLSPVSASAVTIADEAVSV